MFELRKKKRIRQIIVLSVFLGVFAGVLPSSDRGQAQVNLRFWTGGYPKEGIRAFQEYIAQFEKNNPSIRVEYTAIPWDKYRSKLRNAFTIGPGPDVFIDSLQRRWDEMGALEPMAQYLDRFPDKDKLDPTGLDTGTLDGTLVGVPYQRPVWTVMYNKEMFKKRGVDPEVDVLYLDTLMDFAKRLTWDSDGNGTTDSWGFGLLGGRLSDHFFLVTFYSKGGEWATKKGELVVDKYKEQLIDTLKYIKAIAEYTPGGPKAAAARAYAQVRPLFAEEAVSMMNDNCLVLYSVLTSINPSILPKVGYFVVDRGMMAYDYLYIVKTSKHKEEAWDFIEYMLGKDPMVATNLPRGALPVRTDLQNHPLVKQNPAASAGLRQWKTRSNGVHPLNYWKEYSEMRPYLFDAVAAVLLGVKDPEGAINEMLENIHRDLKG